VQIKADLLANKIEKRYHASKDRELIATLVALISAMVYKQISKSIDAVSVGL
jgi:hypothetical protein